jgi:tRNA pseudouridine32 synthase/23S rRNA pseudouridine746 synthase/23S rRNA pseudouridine1911/1915/1917 synthase
MKYRPEGFDILYEDQDVIVGNKTAGFLTVAALWEKNKTIHHILNNYVRKGSQHSKKCVYVVHRLDQATSGVLIFAKSEAAKDFLKDNWKTTEKIYYTIVHGKMIKKSGLISSYLSEDDDYMVHSSQDSSKGKKAETEYTVIEENPKYSVVKINLLTGKKNQIRVHMSDAGHPVVGDTKYGPNQPGTFKNLMLHSFSITFTHPYNGKRIHIEAKVPPYFKQLIDFKN